MLRDIQQSNSIPVSDSLSVQDRQEVTKIIQYIDFSINKFYNYYMTYGDSIKEDRISDLMISCFEDYLSSYNNGYLSIRFSMHPTEEGSTREPDIGVFPRPIINQLRPILVFEAKRLYDSSHSREYICGETGGIERFKRGRHAANDNVCGMIGYVQVHDSNYWFEKVNKWIDDLAKENIDKTIDWTDENEKLVTENSFVKGRKCSSLNYRKSKNNHIQIFHYFVELL